MLGEPDRIRSENSAKGAELEIRFLHLLHDNGFDARLSNDNRAWDIEVYLAKGIHRIQVKAGFWDQGSWKHSLKKSNGHGKNKIPYLRSDFDFLAFDGPDHRLYLVPSICLHLSQKTKNSLPTLASGMHQRYSDYLIHAPN